MTADRSSDLDSWRRGRRRPPQAAPSRARWIIAIGGLFCAVGATLIVPVRPMLIWNVSESAPVGLYAVGGRQNLVIGDMVAAQVPAPWRTLGGTRGYIPVNVPLIKRVAAAGGDRVCAVESEIWINGKRAARRLSRDGAGRSMPAWSGCRILRKGELFLIMPRASSFDARYFGPTRSGDIVGQVHLLWAR